MVVRPPHLVARGVHGRLLGKADESIQTDSSMHATFYLEAVGGHRVLADEVEVASMLRDLHACRCCVCGLLGQRARPDVVQLRGSGEGWTCAFFLVPGQSQLLIYFSQGEYRVFTLHSTLN